MTHIATLIPAYKTEYLGDVLSCLASQTWRDFRVIVSDDSPEAAITRSLRAGRHAAELRALHVTVLQGPRSAWQNHHHVLRAWNGSTPLVHLMMDDDLLAPDFYREHVAMHADGIPSASVSLRCLTDAAGRPCGTLPLPLFIQHANGLTVDVDTSTLHQSTIVPVQNWLGELSNMVFSRRAAASFPVPPAHGVSYFGLPDMSMLLSGSHCGPVRVLRRYLGGFRQSPSQTTQATQSTALQIAHVAWVAFALQSRRDGWLDDGEIRRAIALSAQRCMQAYLLEPAMRPFFELVARGLDELDAFEAAFGTFWQGLLRACTDTHPGAAAYRPLAAAA